MRRILAWSIWIPIVFLVCAKALSASASIPVSIIVHGKSSVRIVPPLFFGQNIEWTSSGDGLWNAATHQPIQGISKLLRPLHIGLIRFPGGSLTNCYRWEWAIGPYDTRKPNEDWFSAQTTPVNGIWTLKGGQTAPSLYGFDEHMQFVRDVGAKGALITVNATYFPGSSAWGGSPQEAAAWVAYANARVNGSDVKIGTDYRGVNYHTSRYWARLRTRNGHPSPYKCLYWEIGNEVNDIGQGAGLTGSSYAERVHQYAIAMHAVDPTIKIGAVLGFEWLKDILTVAGKDIGFLIYHFYAPGSDMQGATFWSNGARTVTFTAPGGPCQLLFLASGTPANGVWPNLRVSVDNRLISNVAVSADEKKGRTQTYPVQIDPPAGEHQLTFAYTNDLMTQTEDRNLFVYGIWLQTADGGRTPITLLSSLDEMHLLASEPIAFASRFADIDKAIHTYAPTLNKRIQVYVTEFNAMYGMSATSAQALLQMKSALMVDGILQHALSEPRCVETNFWCLNSWYFQLIHPGNSGAFLTSDGDIYSLFQPLEHGVIIRTDVHGGVYPNNSGVPSASLPFVSAVAVRNGRRMAVNIVNYDPDDSTNISIQAPGMHIIGTPFGRICISRTLESSNTPEHPDQVRLESVSAQVIDGKVAFTLPAHSAGTIVFNVR